jgi:XTP/dITP diphosphohydrolase
VPLLVLALGIEESAALTLEEWDDLLARRRVFFERVDHPLIERLAKSGIPAGAFDDEPSAADEDSALVAEPDSPRILELARAGARVSVGPIVVPDALTAAHSAPVIRRGAAALAGVVAIMARLRSDDGCPWDREQTHESLRVSLLEEAHEVLEAIDRGLLGPDLEEELGDVLLQVAFHSRIAQLEGRFDIAGVADGLVAKLIHRHPHVFGDTAVTGAAEVLVNWEALKRKEKGRRDPFDDIPRSLPALVAAAKTQKRAAGLGFHPDEEAARGAAAGALEAGDLGGALFWVVALARLRGEDAEGALRRAVADFVAGIQPPGRSPTFPE